MKRVEFSGFFVGTVFALSLIGTAQFLVLLLDYGFVDLPVFLGQGWAAVLTVVRGLLSFLALGMLGDSFLRAKAIETKEQTDAG